MDNLRRIVHVVPGELGDVDQAVDAAQINESAEVNDGGNGALETHTRLKLGQDLGALSLTGLLEDNTTGQNDIVAVTIHLDNASLNTGAQIGVQILDSAQINEGCRQEATQADVEDQAALDDLDDFALHILALLELLLNTVPSTLVLRASLGEDETTFLVLLLKDHDFDGIAEFYNVCRINIFTDRQFARRNDALRLIADVKQNLIMLNLDDLTGHQISLIKICDVAVNEFIHFLIGHVVKRKDGRVLNLTQRWTPFENGAPVSCLPLSRYPLLCS